MIESSSEIAGPERLAWWRRAILFVLEVNPPWWGWGKLWALVLILLAIGARVIGGPGVRSAGYVGLFQYVLNADGQWALNEYRGAGVKAVVEFTVPVETMRGNGWTRWMIRPVVARQTFPDKTGSYIGGIDSPEARRAGFAARVDELEERMQVEGPGDDVESTRKTAVVVRLARDGRTSHVEGNWRYLLWRGSRLAQLAAMGGLVIAFIVGSLRALARAEYWRRLDRLQVRQCPMCRYDMSAAPARVCPECGADAEAVEREARGALRWYGGRSKDEESAGPLPAP